MKPIDTGSALTAAREQLGMSKAALARELGLSDRYGRNTVHRLESSDRIPQRYRLAMEMLVERKTDAR